METSIRSKVILPHHRKAPKAAFRSLRSRVTGIDVVDVFNVSGRPASARMRCQKRSSRLRLLGIPGAIHISNYRNLAVLFVQYPG